jgi:hypothetical protein
MKVVGPESLNPLDELRGLDQQVDQVADLAGLKPIFYRLDEIAKEYSGDFEVQLAVDDVKQRVVSRGKALREAQHAAPPPSPSSAAELPPAAAPPPAAKSTTATPTPVATPKPAQSRVAPAKTWPQPMMMGAAVGAIVAILLLALLVNQARKRNLTGAGVQLQVATIPTGAAVRITSAQAGETKCVANCTVSLPPGNYQVTAFLDGYEPAASGVTVSPGRAASVNLALEPAPQTVRILTDLDQGKVAFDDQAPTDLVDGQFVIEKVPPGKHTVKVISKNGEASFAVEIADAKMPTVTGPVAARNLMAVVISSLGSQGRAMTSAGTMKLTVNGQAQADASPAGVELSNFQPGVDEILVGEGTNQRSMKESFGPAPMLTAFVKSDLNIGTLIVSTGEDDVRVFVNNKEYPRKTRRGQVRIPAIGDVSVRVAKEGFEAAPVQTAEVKKGSEARVEFKMQALPQLATLQIRGATPGVEVVIDQKSAGTVGDDGAFTSSAVQPGDHTIELRRDQYVPRRLQRAFRAGQTVALGGGDVALAAAMGTLKLARTPADAAVVYRRADEAQNHELRGNQVDLPPGQYIVTARAQGYNERAERVQVAAGETHSLDLALAKVVVAPPPPPKIAGMADFDDPGAWSKQGDLWTHKGGGFIPFKPRPNGVITFTVQLLRGGNLFRGGRIRWVLQYVDSKNYDLFELDRKNLWSKVIIDGKTFERGKYEHNLSDKDKFYTLQIESAPERLTHRVMNGGEWKPLDTWAETGRDFTQGKFAFLVQGSDEIGITDFQFKPR